MQKGEEEKKKSVVCFIPEFSGDLDVLSRTLVFIAGSKMTSDAMSSKEHIEGPRSRILAISHVIV